MDIKFWHFIMIMVIVALPTAIKYDHYIALLIWAIFLLDNYGSKF